MLLPLLWELWQQHRDAMRMHGVRVVSGPLAGLALTPLALLGWIVALYGNHSPVHDHFSALHSTGAMGAVADCSVAYAGLQCAAVGADRVDVCAQCVCAIRVEG